MGVQVKKIARGSRRPRSAHFAALRPRVQRIIVALPARAGDKAEEEQFMAELFRRAARHREREGQLHARRGRVGLEPRHDRRRPAGDERRRGTGVVLLPTQQARGAARAPAPTSPAR